MNRTVDSPAKGCDPSLTQSFPAPPKCVRRWAEASWARISMSLSISSGVTSMVPATPLSSLLVGGWLRYPLAPISRSTLSLTFRYMSWSSASKMDFLSTVKFASPDAGRLDWFMLNFLRYMNCCIQTSSLYPSIDIVFNFEWKAYSFTLPRL